MKKWSFVNDVKDFDFQTTTKKNKQMARRSRLWQCSDSIVGNEDGRVKCVRKVGIFRVADQFKQVDAPIKSPCWLLS